MDLMAAGPKRDDDHILNKVNEQSPYNMWQDKTNLFSKQTAVLFGTYFFT